MPKKAGKRKTPAEAVGEWSKNIAGKADEWNEAVASVTAEEFAASVKGKDAVWSQNTQAAVEQVAETGKWSKATSAAAGDWKAGVSGKGEDWVAGAKEAEGRYQEAVGKIITEVGKCDGKATDADAKAYIDALKASGVKKLVEEADKMTLDEARGRLYRSCLAAAAKAGKLKASPKKK